MPSDVVCACEEGKNENWQKGDHGGFELACMNPGVCVADTRDGRGPTNATYWRLGTLGYLNPSDIATILLFTVAYDSRRVACPFRMVH